MPFPRSAGLLLHPTSLPGRFGVGDLGPTAHAWLDQLAAAGMGLWQVLPLGPTGYGDSPYQAFSAFAGNPLLVSPEALRDDGLLSGEDLADPPGDLGRVDYGVAIAWKLDRLDRAFARFRAGAAPALAAELAAFRAEQAAWLPDFARFMALKRAHRWTSWTAWPRELARRDRAALAHVDAVLGEAIEAEVFRQFAFFRQWRALHAHARSLGIRIVGDVPIFVAHDSADVWQHPELFQLDDAGQPVVVAGVPPDYFSATGQRWGNPLYRWDVLAARGHDWWIDRLRATLAMVDVARVDHFRGFVAAWEIPAADDTAVGGRWMPGPGAALFESVRDTLGALPLIAEDLGVITPEVEGLRDRFAFPGMRVLQFAFGGDARDAFLPHNYVRNTVVYTGTHDNDTTRGWYEESSAPVERDRVRRYLGVDGRDLVWDLIRAAFASVADTAIVPVQDVLDLGSAARMNLPGRASGNWGWRLREGQLAPPTIERLQDLAVLYGRESDGGSTRPKQ